MLTFFINYEVKDTVIAILIFTITEKMVEDLGFNIANYANFKLQRRLDVLSADTETKKNLKEKMLKLKIKKATIKKAIENSVGGIVEIKMRVK
tara:strand:- start:123 stop:401 length:279 start_codon:yes stop_codon:yes gene_type:complete